MAQTDAGTVVTLPGDVLFDFDKSNIRSDAEPILAKLAELITSSAVRRIEITGHTDAKGADNYNQALSERRAKAARDYLVDVRSLDPALFITRGAGESWPVAPNTLPDGSDNPEGRQRNRRVEVLLAR